MNKFKILIILIFFVCIITSGCKKSTTMILFNSNPITKETVLQNDVNFIVGQKIYYLFITEKQLPSTTIRVELRKKDEKTEFWGVKIVYGNDYRLYKDQLYYFNDYIVLHEAGHYYMLVYLRNNMDKPLAVADFYVNN